MSSTIYYTICLHYFFHLLAHHPFRPVLLPFRLLYPLLRNRPSGHCPTGRSLPSAFGWRGLGVWEAENCAAPLKKQKQWKK